MRTKLRAALLLGALAGTGLTSIDAAQAAEKVKGKTEVTKSKVAPVSEKSQGQAAAKGKAPLMARQGRSQPLAGQRSGKANVVAEKAKAVPVTRAAAVTPRTSGKTVVRHAAEPNSARPAQGSRIISSSANSGYSRGAQKKAGPRVLASNVDVWQETGHLALQSGSALVIPQDGGEPLYEKNANAVVPIASITKVMTAMVVLDSLPNLQAPITISEEDVDYLRGSRSRLHVGTVIPRETALLLALMSSENRAANALARHYPGGMPAFVAAMNRKAASLGMARTHFEDPTGLNSNNVSTAYDLARMVAAAHRYPLIREFSTTAGARAEVNGRELGFHNTNQLVSSPTWEIGLSKTGYIHEAGKCLVMQARVADKPVVIVLLDSTGKQTRIGDANRIKRWMESASLPGKPPTRA
ncbi:D-alanyl-D-alanine endopeptidase [Accumulibacter sp.]|uniref:D-alanyl-D-alanine endopeptidase n=1 Tax=Accumulibacter sp. TaxID=2053492 RepID=UPI0026314DFD|nr:D-alanyl-D-alanine endopeptidase [Accumulibacter sp.]